ncbi:MAG TPA: hypothetical protein VF483_08030 [Gemmatimonadaceae bacterium]
MAGLVLDGAGQVKMDTLNTCIALHQRLNGWVEAYAVGVKNNKPEASILNNIKRNLPVLAGKLKAQFGMISDLATAVYMSSSRGAAEQMRVRTMREGMAALKMQLDIAVTQTIAKHEKHD